MTEKEAFDSFARRTDRSIYPIRHDKHGVDDWPLVCTWMAVLADGIERAKTDEDLDKALLEYLRLAENGMLPDLMTLNLLGERLANDLVPNPRLLPSWN